MGAEFHDVGLRFGGNAFFDFPGDLSRGRCDEVECHDSDALYIRASPDGPRLPSLVSDSYFSDGTDSLRWTRSLMVLMLKKTLPLTAWNAGAAYQSLKARTHGLRLLVRMLWLSCRAAYGLNLCR